MSQCKCGCGQESTREFLAGHDQKLRTALERRVGGLLSLRGLIDLAESHANGEVSEQELSQSVRDLFRGRP